MPNLHLPALGASNLLPFLRRSIVPAARAPQIDRSLPMPLPLAGLSLVPPRTGNTPKPVPLPRLSAAAALAHDARGAVTSLQLLSGLLAAPGVLDSNFSGYAADLEAITAVLTSLVSRIPTLEKTDGAVAQAQPRILPLPHPARSTASMGHIRCQRAATVGKAVESCGRLLRAVAGSSVDVYLSSESNLPPLALDDETLARVLMNLVKNASEAMPGGGSVRITARRALSRETPAVLLHISDNGPGIPAHAIQRIFEPGFTSKTHAGAAETRGLGLAIVRELLQAAGGEVRVASTRRRGTTFELRIPCLKTTQYEA